MTGIDDKDGGSTTEEDEVTTLLKDAAEEEAAAANTDDADIDLEEGDFNTMVCFFCRNSEDKVGPLMGYTDHVGLHRYQCYTCAKKVLAAFLENPRCMEAVHSALERNESERLSKILYPREVFSALSRSVIGQDRAKRVLSIACHKHQKGIVARALNRPIRMKKENVMLIGPTGVGKTELARQLARHMGVPFAIGDATTLTEAGYVGEDVENLLLKLIQAADGNIHLAERGVIFVDEIDKIGKKTQNVSITRDVSGEGVQQCLLKMIEGTIANVPPQGGRKHPEQSCIQIDTTNILFICGGAFDGIEDIVARRCKQRAIGFGTNPKMSQKDETDKDVLRQQILPEDLIQFGMIPEFVGRFPVIAPLNMLGVDDLARILHEPENSVIAQLQQSFQMSNVQLDFEPDAIKVLAAKAFERKTGARGLEAVMSNLMEEIEFSIDDYAGQRLLITKEMAEGAQPITAIECRRAA